MHPSLTSQKVVIATAVLALAGAAASCSNYDTSGTETTEDAFVSGNVVAVTAQVGGVVTALSADTTDHVKAGVPLVVLDDVDAKLALDRAKAQLAKSVRLARTQVAAAGQNGANVALRRVDLNRAKADLARRRELLASGAISGEEVQHAEEAARVAEAALEAAQQQWAASKALVDRVSIESNPEVMTAAAQVRDAYIAAFRTVVPAPVSGVVTKRNVQLGQKINPGVALMSVVPLDHLWVDANFKESQLAHIRPGQPVTLTADLYGRSITYTGTVVGQDAGTGSAFALLPAQNATGNWIKVVQRVPIRIALEPEQLMEYPLQVGLSMRVSVDTSRRDTPRLSSAQSDHHGDKTDVLTTPLKAADDEVKAVIAANR